MTWPTHLIWTAAWTSLWCILHSLLITHRTRDGVRALFPTYHVWDRLVYVAFSSASLGLLLLWVHTLPEQILWDWPGWWSWVRWLGLAEAGLLFWLGARTHNLRTFLGLNQLRDQAAGRSVAPTTLTRHGILGVIRHPWYTGALVFLAFCLPYSDVNLVWRGIFVLYLLIGTELEERKLLRELGEPYAAYRREVPRFCPLPFRRS